MRGTSALSKSKTADNTAPQANQSAQSGDPSEGGRYLVVEQWGVRFPLSKDLQGDIIFKMSNADSSGAVLFASKKLNALNRDDTCNLVRQPNGSYLGGVQASLARLSPETYPAASLRSYKNQLNYVKKLGNYEYYARKQVGDPAITCLTGQHEEFSNIEQSLTDELNTAFEQVGTY